MKARPYVFLCLLAMIFLGAVYYVVYRLCYARDILPEGMLGCGVLTAFVCAMIAILIFEEMSEQEIIAAEAGDVGCQNSCVVHTDKMRKGRGVPAVLAVCEFGLVIDAQPKLYTCICYEDLDKIDVESFGFTVRMAKGGRKYRFVYRTKVSARAALDVIMANSSLAVSVKSDIFGKLPDAVGKADTGTIVKKVPGIKKASSVSVVRIEKPDDFVKREPEKKRSARRTGRQF